MKRRSNDTIGTGFKRACEWMLTLAALALLLAVVVVPRAAGATPYAVLTGSMTPSAPPGTLVVVRPIAPAEITVGTVITYQPRADDRRVVTHRVVGQGFDAVGRPVFRTRGDANNVADAAMVRDFQVVGERWYLVPYVGHLTTALEPAQRRAATWLLAGGLLAYALVMFGGALRDRSARPRPVAHA